MVVVGVGQKPEVNFIFAAVFFCRVFQAGEESAGVSDVSAVNDYYVSVFCYYYARLWELS